MGNIEEQWRRSMSRRKALASFAGLLAGSPLLRAQEDPRPLSAQKRALGIREMRNVWDFEAVFHANVSEAVYTYTDQSCGTEWTKRRNRRAFEWVDLAPGTPVDPTSISLPAQIYDTKMALPIMISPSARHGDLHPEGEAGTHRAASATGTPYIIANGPSVPVEKIAAAGDGPMWYQLYGQQNIEQNRENLERAQAVGCQAIVITVDQQLLRYPRQLHVRNLGGVVRSQTTGRSGGPPTNPNAGFARYHITGGRTWMDWNWVDAVRKLIRVPVLMKGIQTAEDARLCVEHGVGIIVSNHGGRVCDYGLSTLECLPEIVAEVRGRVPIIIDSGFRRGSDILKALAMGANVVCVSRPVRWGLGAFGGDGAQRVLEILQAEFLQAAAEHGHKDWSTINTSAVKVNFS